MASEVTVGTDGSSRGNPGPAGWAWVVDGESWQCGSLLSATSIVAELTAAHRALLAVPAGVPVVVLSDSQFVVNVAAKWARGWSRRGWVTKEGKPIANRGLVQELWETISGRPGATRFEWVRGHNGHPLNEAADRLATRASRQCEHNGRRAGREVAGPGWGRT